eukprot:CAMPEP_0171087244 /NCGR_PEP_ID=MMETSP0766_2-20121228/20027_1 /TAXON_ID=439317 /ORGANISM="Gambierdiscus australes, Strain CAWD 149" /LENGTH=381 /DNA_ID=CAMNT_0011544935 /DNA_START=178 /DNA_END=1323 /DNA_ORIENTATION=-
MESTVEDDDSIATSRASMQSSLASSQRPQDSEASPPHGAAVSSTVVAPSCDWAAWTLADVGPPLADDDDWADWSPVSKVPATRELSAAAPERPTVWPRFASVEAWISRLSEEAAKGAGAEFNCMALAEDVGMVREECPSNSSSSKRSSSKRLSCAWCLRPSVGTWLTVRITLRRTTNSDSPRSSPCSSGLPRCLIQTVPGAHVRFPAGGWPSMLAQRLTGANSLSALEPELPWHDMQPACAALASDKVSEETDVPLSPASSTPSPPPEKELGLRWASWSTLPSVGTWLAHRVGSAVANDDAVSRHNFSKVPKAATLFDLPRDEVFWLAAAVLPKVPPPNTQEQKDLSALLYCFDPYAPGKEGAPPISSKGHPGREEECPIA